MGPADGSPRSVKTGESFGNLKYADMLSLPPVIGPVRDVIHCCRASSDAVIFAFKLNRMSGWKCSKVRTTYLTIVSFAAQLNGIIGSVLKFFPTLGRLKTVLIPTCAKTLGSPMPEFKRI